MSALRLHPLQPPYTQEVATALAKMMPPNAPTEPLMLFRVLVQHGDLAARMRPLAAGLLGHGKLTPLERELLILRTCARCGAEYEWGVHVTGFAAWVGLTEAQVNGTVHAKADAPIWTAAQSTLIALADALHDQAAIPDALWEQLNAYWQADQIIEMLILCGWYHAISYVANVASLPPEAWAARFPPA